MWLVIAGLQNNLPAAVWEDITGPAAESSRLDCAAAAMTTFDDNVMRSKT